MTFIRRYLKMTLFLFHRSRFKGRQKGAYIINRSYQDKWISQLFW